MTKKLDVVCEYTRGARDGDAESYSLYVDGVLWKSPKGFWAGRTRGEILIAFLESEGYLIEESRKYV